MAVISCYFLPPFEWSLASVQTGRKVELIHSPSTFWMRALFNLPTGHYSICTPLCNPSSSFFSWRNPGKSLSLEKDSFSSLMNVRLLPVYYLQLHYYSVIERTLHTKGWMDIWEQWRYCGDTWFQLCWSRTCGSIHPNSFWCVVKVPVFAASSPYVELTDASLQRLAAHALWTGWYVPGCSHRWAETWVTLDNLTKLTDLCSK